MAELRADDPSWRDKLARLILGDEKPSEMKRRAVQGTLGSTGLGNDGVSLVDATPLGMVFSGNDAVRSAQNGNYGEAALNALGAVPAGAVTAGAIKLAKGAKQAENIASRVVPSYSPPVKSQRPFEADYPNGARADAAGKLTHDIGGRMLAAEYIAGRRLVGADDVPLQSAEIRSIGEKATGRSIEAAPQGAGRGAGYLRLTPITRQPEQIFLSNKLSPTQADSVLGHEVGHVIDQIAGEIPTKGLSRELDPMYDALNTGRERTKNFTKPQHLGYSGDEIPREQMADAIRAYMTDPNYIKTVAPKTAARIREYVNTHPKLKDIIQFNSLAAAGGAGALAMGGADQAEAQTMSGPWEKYKAPETMPGAPWQKYAQQVAQPQANPDGTFGQPPEGIVLNPQTGQMEDLRSPANPNIPQGGANALALGIGQGVGFNMLDEVSAALSVPFGGDYDYNLARMREAERRASEDHPMAYYGGQIGGALGTGIGLAKGGLSAANAAINSGAKLPTVALASGAEGVALGAGYGFGAGEGVEGRLQGAKTGGAVGGLAGFAVPFALGGASKTVQKTRAPFIASPERTAAVQTLSNEGIPLSAGQKTGSKWLQYRESELGGAKAADLMDEQARAFTDAVMRRAGGSGLATPDVLGDLQQTLSKGFDDISARNTLILDKGMVDDVIRVMDDIGDGLDVLKKPVFENYRKKIMNEFMKNKGRVSGEWYQRTRSTLSEKARAARGDSNELSDAYRGLRNALDEGMERSIQKLNPADLGEWKDLRRKWDNFRVVADAFRGAGEAGGQGFITPAKLADAASKGKNGLPFATGKNDFTDLAKAGQAAMPPLPIAEAAQRLASQGVMAAVLGGGGGVIGGQMGALAGLAGPYLAGKMLMSKPMQNYLARQIVSQPLTPQSRSLLTALINAQGGLLSGRLATP